MILMLTLRRVLRYWQLNLILLSALVLAATLLAGLPILVTAIAGDNLAQSLQMAAVSQRNLIVRGEASLDDPPAEIATALGGLWRETMAIREAAFDALPAIFHADGSETDLSPVLMVMHLYSFDRLDERASLLDGRWPETNLSSASALEAVIGREATERTGLAIGDAIASDDGRYRAYVVGIVEPIDPSSEVWWGDTQQIPFTMWRRIQFNPDSVTNNVALLVPPEAMVTHVTPALSWRVILNYEFINAQNAANVRQTVVNLQAGLTGQGLTMETNLIELLDAYQTQVSQARVSLLLLVLQSVLAIFYMWGMLGGFSVEGSLKEASTMFGRGFSRGQLTGTFALSTGILALLAWPSGPLLAESVFRLWTQWRGGPRLTSIPAESWWLALGAVLFGWLSVVISVYLSAGHNLIDWQRLHSRPEQTQSGRRRPVWDFLLLSLGGLVYWQLTQAAAATQGDGIIAGPEITGTADPFLLIGPSLLLLGVGLIALRLFPLLLRLIAWASRQTVGLVWPLGAARMSRQTEGLNRIILLISLTAGLSFFAVSFASSLDAWQRMMARYVVGSDLRLRQPQEPMAQLISSGDTPGVGAATEVYHGEATFSLNEYQRFQIDLLAVDPATFARVVTFPPGISPFEMNDIMRVLESGSGRAPPVVISANVITRHLNRGDRVAYRLGLEKIEFEVTGIIGDFPLLEEPFAITNLTRLEQLVDLSAPLLTRVGTRELWLELDAEQHELTAEWVLEQAGADALLGDAQVRLRAFQTNLISREATAAFTLNALILILLSGVGYMLFQVFTTRRRLAELGILQAIGLSNSQLRQLLILEGLSGVLLGLIMGGGIGYGLVVMMRPFLSHILALSIGNVTIERFLINWPLLAGIFAALVGIYGLALAIVLIWQTRAKRLTLLALSRRQ